MGGPWKTKVKWERGMLHCSGLFGMNYHLYFKEKLDPQSGHFIELATRLSKTGHEERFSQQFHKYGLAADIPVSYIDVGLKAKHPILCVENTLGTLSKHNKLHILFQGTLRELTNSFGQNGSCCSHSIQFLRSIQTILGVAFQWPFTAMKDKPLRKNQLW